jgi:hypothetical protein
MAKIVLGSAFGKVAMLISSTIYPYQKMPKTAILLIISIPLIYYGYSILGLANRYCYYSDCQGE